MGCFTTNYHDITGCYLALRSVGMIRPSITLTFCLMCSFGGALGLMVGLAGLLSAPSNTNRDGVCEITRPGTCTCAEWEARDGQEFCSKYEIDFPETQFTPLATNTVTNASQVCVLASGKGSIPSCLHTTVVMNGNISVEYAAPRAGQVLPCEVSEETYQCFPAEETLISRTDNRTREFRILAFAGIGWLGLALSWLCMLVYRDATKRGVRYQFLHRELNADGSEDERDVPALRSGCHMYGDRVAANVDGGWAHGTIERRHGMGAYDVSVGGKTHKVMKQDVIPAGFKEGNWVVVVQEIVLPSITLAPGLLGVVLGLSEDQGDVRVTVGGHVFSPTPGQVAPTATLRRGVRVEVRGADDDTWREAVLQGVQGAGIVLVTRPGGSDVKAFKWCRRLVGIQVHSLPEPVPDMDVPGTFVFVDPESKLAPTVMEAEEVELYGGVRQVAKDLAEYRAAPMSKLVTGTALLSGMHLVAQHLQREEREHERDLQERRPPDLNPVAAQQQQAEQQRQRKAAPGTATPRAPSPPPVTSPKPPADTTPF